MVIEFGAKNFSSFKEGFEVSFKIGDSISNIMCVKGANASGKTTVLKVPSFITHFCRDSFSEYKPEENILFFPFFDSKDSTHLYIVFSFDKVEYKYELELTQEKVISEILYKKVKRYSKVIERANNKILYTTKEYKSLKSIVLRDNASFISTAKQYGLVEINTIFDFFDKKIISNVGHVGLLENMVKFQEINRAYYRDENVFSFVKNILIESDTGISDIEIIEKKDAEDNLQYFPNFKHKINTEEKILSYAEQSSGVKSLYKQLALYWIALNEGGLLIHDEFDINLHPDLLPKLIELFENTEFNKNHAQLLFTTHNTDIMDKLGKYKVVLVNKEYNQSYLYRLDELSSELIRNDRAISPIYNTGRIGGKPRI